MRILFVYSFYGGYRASKPLRTMENIQFGLSYLSSLLKQQEHETRLLVLSRVFGEKENRRILRERFDHFRPQVVCFTSVSTEYPYVSSVARYIQSQYPEAYRVVGGAHVSLNPENVLQDGFDAVCIGEGEQALVELVSQLQRGARPSSIPNMWIRHGTETEKNATRPFLTDLDSLPFPDREMWIEWIDEKALRDPSTRISLLLGRGCPFQCTYCCNHSLSKLASGPYVRFRSPGNIVQEIQALHDRFPEKEEIYLEVETIGANPKWGIELCSRLEQLNTALPRPLRCGVNLRVTPNADYGALFEAMQKSNFRFVNIGLESGSERIRREVLRRNYSNQDVIQTVQLARRFGLQVAFLNMMGLPGETLSDFHETVNMNRTCAPDWHGTSIFYPYPGTDLHRLCQEQGLLQGEPDTEVERTRAILDLPGFSKQQIQRNYVWFDYHVYKGRKPTLKLPWISHLGRMNKPKWPWMRLNRPLANAFLAHQGPLDNPKVVCAGAISIAQARVRNPGLLLEVLVRQIKAMPALEQLVRRARAVAAQIVR